MADIQIPNRAPTPYQFQQPDLSGIAAIYNRPKPAEIGAELAGKGVNAALENYYNQQKLKATAFGEGGPFLYNLLYGKGQQASTTPLGQTAGVQPLAPMSQTNNPPTAGVGATPPTNGMGSPQDSSQTMPSQPQSQQAGQPSIDPMSPGGTIHTSITQLGHPDFAGYGQQIQNITGQMTQGAGMYGPSKFGQANQQMLGGQLNALKTGMEAQTAPLTYQKTANEVAMQPTELAQKQQELSNAQQQIPMEVKKTVASEISKQGQDSQQIRDLQVLSNNLQKSLGPDLGILGNVKGEISQQSGGRFGSKTAANMMNSTIPLATGLNTVLSHRFNAGEVQALANSLIPQPKDTPAYQQQKLQNLNNLLNVMASGNEQNVQNVKDAILGGTVPKVGIPASQSSVSQNRSINSKAQYDALPNGAPYIWNGQPHIKGRS